MAKSSYYYHKENMKGFTFISDSNTTIQNNPAWQIEYAGNPTNSDITNYTSIFTKANNIAYEIFYSSKQPDYSKYFPEAMNVLNNIEFIPSKPPEEKRPSFLD